MNTSKSPLNLSSSSNETAAPVQGGVAWELALIILITGPLSIITITSNLLVIISFRVNPHLRTVSNYFLLSLAVADLILGAISMNLYTTYILLGRWALGPLACDVWLAVDYVASNASVMNLLAISFDRYLSVTRPLTYRVHRTPRRAGIMISLAWGVSLVLWAPAILFWQHVVGERTVPEGECFIQFLSQPVITFGTAIAAFYLPVSVMVALYWRIYRETERRSQLLAGLTGTQSQDQHVTSQASRQLQSQSSSNASSFGDAQTQTQARLQAEQSQSSERRARFCPGWWERKTASTQTAYSSTSSLDVEEEDGEDNGKVVHIPLVQMNKKNAPVEPSGSTGGRDSGIGQSGSQLSLDPSVRPSNSCKAAAAQSPSLTVASAPRSQIRSRTVSVIRENKAARTLSAILLAFIVTWTPYNIMVLVSTFCDLCVPEKLWQLGYWLCYVNSTVNPLCYALCNKHFRVTFRALLLCRWQRVQRKRWARSWVS